MRKLREGDKAMPVRMHQPLSTMPNADEVAMLEMLQGNILRGHGRHHTAHVFLRFDSTRASEVRQFLRENAESLTSAREQAANAAAVRAAREAGHAKPETPPFVACALSHHGYEALGIDEAMRPADPAFRGGMKARGAILSDPQPDEWEEQYRGEVDAMVLIGGDSNADDESRSDQVDDALAELDRRLPVNAVQVLGIERGRAYFNGNGDGIEHFGFADGRSQPLLRDQDVAREAANGGGIVRWNPAFPLRQVLEHDPSVEDPNAFGSYFIYRKLEQNVRGFKDAEEALARQLTELALAHGRTFDPELVGAKIVGRFRDGTPVLLQYAEGMHNPVPNDFDYSGDQQGLRCPFHAHIRKANPRGDVSRLRGIPIGDGERSHILARRGISYGDREQNGRKEFTDRPEQGVGLLFMSFQKDIVAQFEFTQKSWVNNDDFIQPETGFDPVIGQGGNVQHTHRAGWGDSTAPAMQQTFAGFVTLKGGEYFFAPSLEFFRTLPEV